MQIMAMIQWSHFAYMVISMALLGFGASGTLLALSKKWFTGNVSFMVPLLMIFCGISMSLITLFSNRILGRFDSYLLFIDFTQIYYLLLIYFAFFIPFFFGGLAIGLVYVSYVSQVGKLYFADLFGSGVGGLAMIGIFWIIYPASLPGIISIFPVVAGILLLPGKFSLKKYLTPFLALIIPVYLMFYPPNLPVSQYKSISGTMNLPGAEIVREKSSPFGFIQIVSAPSLRYAPGLSLAFTGEITVRNAVFVNGNWFGPVIEWSGNDTSHYLDYTTNSLPYEICKPGNVLILDSGTGLFASHALSRGADKVTSVEPNTVTTGMLKDKMREISDSVFINPHFEMKGMHSRSYILSDTSRYSLIILPTTETFGGTSGINALNEQYLLTLEAFSEMWDLLSENGMIAVTCWMDYPVRAPLKLLGTLVSTHESKSNSQVSDHLVAIRSWGTLSFVLKKSPLSYVEAKNIRRFCDEMYFDPLFLPGIQNEERTKYNSIQDTTFFELADMIFSGKSEELYRTYDFNVRPATDNRPYFSQFLKLSELGKFRETFGSSSVPFLETGYIIVLITFIQITLAAMVFILLPLFVIKWKGEGKLYTVLHFSGIGIGFMFIEIIFIQQFILYFGNPIYAASAVLSSMLLCSGVGSLVSSKVESTKSNIALVVTVIVMLIIFYVLFLSPVLRASINSPLLLKIVFSLIIIGPAAFFMGMPFPLGLRFISIKNELLIPWAWGINGCLSVISTVLATIIAVEAGYSWVMILAVCAYAIVLMANSLSWEGPIK